MGHALYSASVLVLLCCLSSCSQGGLNADTGFRYGNFCGKNWPARRSNVPSEEVAALQSIPPIDSLDAACKGHDICYATFGDGTPQCDDILLSEMRRMRFSDSRCQSIALNIAAFAISNPDQIGHGRLNLNTLINVPWVGAENVFRYGLENLGAAAGLSSSGKYNCISGTGPFFIR